MNPTDVANLNRWRQIGSTGNAVSVARQAQLAEGNANQPVVLRAGPSDVEVGAPRTSAQTRGGTVLTNPC